jgi:hypothetical protein
MSMPVSVNTSVPHGPHATIAQFQAPSELRPSDVVGALQLAIETCVGIAEQPKPTIATKSIGREATGYEIAFFPSAAREREGRALMQPAAEMPPSPRGLADWIVRRILWLHRLRS